MAKGYIPGLGSMSDDAIARRQAAVAEACLAIALGTEPGGHGFTLQEKLTELMGWHVERAVDGAPILVLQPLAYLPTFQFRVPAQHVARPLASLLIAFDDGVDAAWGELCRLDRERSGRPVGSPKGWRKETPK